MVTNKCMNLNYTQLRYRQTRWFLQRKKGRTLQKKEFKFQFRTWPPLILEMFWHIFMGKSWAGPFHSFHHTTREWGTPWKYFPYISPSSLLPRLTMLRAILWRYTLGDGKSPCSLGPFACLQDGRLLSTLVASPPTLSMWTYTNYRSHPSLVISQPHP
jgi:hypothetical protein